MRLEAVWFKGKKEVGRVDPVVNIVCDDDMADISEIEVKDWNGWFSSQDFCVDADDFVIRVKKE